MFWRFIKVANILAHKLNTTAHVMELMDALTATQNRNWELIQKTRVLQKALDESARINRELLRDKLEFETEVEDLTEKWKEQEIENDILKCEIETLNCQIQNLKEDRDEKLDVAYSEYCCIREDFLEATDELKKTLREFKEYRTVQEIRYQTCRTRADMYHDLYMDLHSRNPQLVGRCL